MDRRELLVGLGAAGAAAKPMGPGVIQGAETWSESAMMLFFDDEVRNGLSFRLSRYPDAGRTWAWCHLLLDGQIYAFTDASLPCEANRITAEADGAAYEVPGMEIRIARLGSSGDLKAISFSFHTLGHRGGKGVDGRGAIPMMAEGVFHPGPLRAGMAKGRFERAGHLEGVIGVGARRVALSGSAKAHEQTQTKPRFTEPFTYAMLWGKEASVIGLSTAKATYGDYQTLEADRPIKAFDVSAPGEKRRFAMSLETGAPIPGAATVLHSYDVPVFGQQWHGHIVSAQVEGRRISGMINDWRPEARTFAAL